jgi:hypothetical protein
MEQQGRLGKIVCIFRGYTVIEVFEPKDGDALAGFSVFGSGLPNGAVYATPEDAMRAIDEVLDARG